MKNIYTQSKFWIFCFVISTFTVGANATSVKQRDMGGESNQAIMDYMVKCSVRMTGCFNISDTKVSKVEGLTVFTNLFCAVNFEQCARDQWAASDLSKSPPEFGLKYQGCDGKSDRTDWDKRVCRDVIDAYTTYNQTVNNQEISNKILSKCLASEPPLQEEDLIACVRDLRVEEFGVINGAAVLLKSTLNNIQGF